MNQLGLLEPAVQLMFRLLPRYMDGYALSEGRPLIENWKELVVTNTKW